MTSSWDVLRAVTPEGEATNKGVHFITTAHGTTQPAQEEKVCFQERERPKRQVRRRRPNAWMDGWIEIMSGSITGLPSFDAGANTWVRNSNTGKQHSVLY